MKEKVYQISQSIDEKRNRLKEKTERSFVIAIASLGNEQKQYQYDKNSGNVHPISYILYGVAGVSAIGAIFTGFTGIRIISLGLAVACAYGGYKISEGRNRKTPRPNHASSVNIGSLKNETMSKVLDIVKKTTNEWDEFMELKQKEIQSAIASSSLNEDKKNELSSKIFLHEVIDISISDFSSMINSATSISDVKQKLDVYKSQLLVSIDNAAQKQIAKYNSLCSL